MGSFSTGLCVGLGLSLLFAPMKGEEMRRLVGERIKSLRGIPPENPELQQSVSQLGTRLQEVQNSAEQARRMSATAQSAVQQTARSAEDIQRDLNRTAQQAGVTPPTTSPVQGTTSSSGTEDIPQWNLNRAAQQMGTTTPGTAQETTSSTEETQQDLNRITQQPGTGNPPPQRRPRG